MSNHVAKRSFGRLSNKQTAEFLKPALERVLEYLRPFAHRFEWAPLSIETCIAAAFVRIVFENRSGDASTSLKCGGDAVFTLLGNQMLIDCDGTPRKVDESNSRSIYGCDERNPLLNNARSRKHIHNALHRVFKQDVTAYDDLVAVIASSFAPRQIPAAAVSYRQAMH